ncbi:hypothetical protein NL50_02050 [Clostridium acetobutylicum]|nr:hypothetical protein NL50_02050 [Clostridium acetobutylicum]
MNIITFNTVMGCRDISEINAVIEESLDNKNILKLDNKYIGNRENVQEDINSFIKKLNIENTESDFVIFGLGCGEHILELINMNLKKMRILIVEPREDVIARFLKLNYANKIIDDDRIYLYLYNEEDLNGILSLFLDEFNISNTKCGVFANYADTYYEEISNLYKSYIDIQNSLLVNMGTHIVHSRHFFSSYMNNLKFIQKSTIINHFKNIYKGMPAVIVSAGPSLSKNIDLLKDYQSKFIVITGGRTLKLLLDKGIRPDFVCVIDPDEPAFEIMKDALDCTVPIIYSEFTNYKVIKNYKGDKIFFTDTGVNDASKDFFEKDIDNLYEGGSVAHVCASLAEYIGCNRIIFVGQDFAYTNDVTCDLNVGGNSNIKNFFYVDDVYGRKVKTDRTLYFYKKAMEEFIQVKKHVDFINCTEGGANIEGAPLIKFKYALEKFGESIKNTEAVSNIIKSNDVLMDDDNMRIKLDGIRQNIKVISSMCTSAVEQYNSYLAFGGKNERDKDFLAHNFNLTNECIFSMASSFKFINVLLSPAIINILGNPNFREKKGMKSEEKLKIKFERNLILYNNIIEAAKEFMKY